MAGSTYSASLVSRVPAASGPPTLVEVDRLVFDKLTYTDELNRPGSATVGLPIRSLSTAVKERLANLRQFPSEVWVYRGDSMEWAGEVQTLGLHGQTVELGCAGLLGYTFRMGIDDDPIWTGADQFYIAQQMVKMWQDHAYGNFGIVTSGIGTCGVLRDRAYPMAELHGVGQRLQELGAVDGGFDMHVDPKSRALILHYPLRGTDLTDSVFLDVQNIESADVIMSVAPDDLVSDACITGTNATGGTATTIYATRSNLALRALYGRSWGSATFDGVSNSATLDGHGDGYLAARDALFLQPGVTLMVRNGVEPGALAPGDTVSYGYDAGLGLQSGTFRLAKVTVDVDSAGSERLGVEFT